MKHCCPAPRVCADSALQEHTRPEASAQPVPGALVERAGRAPRPAGLRLPLAGLRAVEMGVPGWSAHGWALTGPTVPACGWGGAGAIPWSDVEGKGHPARDQGRAAQSGSGRASGKHRWRRAGKVQEPGEGSGGGGQRVPRGVGGDTRALWILPSPGSL